LNSHHAAVNLSGSPIPHVGGLGLIVLGGLITVVRPQVWWAVLAALLAGVLLGIALVMIGRRRMRSRPEGSNSNMLFDHGNP
jgi:O-antigen/teichoic acid export membrane protein